MKKLWLSFAAVVVVSFAVLGWVGVRIHQEAPPIPTEVVTTSGERIIGPGEVMAGQNVWQAMGGMQVGSVWGHGSYVAPDWTADYLHREAVFILDAWAKEASGTAYADAPSERKASLRQRLEDTIRANTYDAATGRVTVDPVRAAAFAEITRHYADVFMNGRAEYAIQKGSVRDPEKARLLSAFFFWSSWAAATNRPGGEASYTNNWPHEPLVGNRPTGGAVVWTGVSIILLLVGVAAMVFFYVSRGYTAPEDKTPATDPLIGSAVTPSQKATVKYFWTVSALILVQIAAGIVTAHYGVEGDAFYGFPLSEWLPYSVSRTWHVQLGVLWIATAWLAAGLFIGPLVSGVEPKGQRLGVNVLFGALLVVVAGSMAGQWMSIQQKFTGDAWFYWGHQGWEYVDLGRIWQIALLLGLFLWLFLVVRSILPALRKPGDQRQLLGLFVVSTVAIAGFYGAGLAWGPRSHLTMIEYWRWWVVHLWVEGFFEVFATVVVAFFFMRLRLIGAKLAAEATVLSATVFLAGGIIGTLHHLYFSGTPLVAMAWGAVFSALEVVPLLLVAYGAWDDFRLSRSTVWISNYKWPIYFFLSVAFWNALGAGIFGFMINPPIALYYMQGLNTTPVHGHAALFGVYGMLGIGLMLFCLKAMKPEMVWREGLIKFSFWTINGGLMAMIVLSLLPVGLLQTWASVEHGYWYARSAEFLQSPLMQKIRWLRVPGDTVFAAGAFALAGFVLRLATKHGFKRG